MDKIDKLFMLYLDEVIILLERPHKCNNIERLMKYKQAFRKTLKDQIKED